LRVRHFGRVHLGPLGLICVLRLLAVCRIAGRCLDQHAEGALVLELIDETTCGLRQHREGTGALRVVRLVDVVDQTAHADDDRRERRHEHDEAELRPDR
jgi:hypothetical protein